MELITLEDLEKEFRIVKIENELYYLKLPYGHYTIKVKIPFEPDQKLASLFGYILGDGCIKSGEENVYFTNKNRGLIDDFKAIIKDLFGIDSKENFNEEREFFEVYPPKTLAKFLVMCGFPKGQKTKKELAIPLWIMEGSKEVKASFIRALFDSDGTVVNSKRNCVISFNLNKKESLLENHLELMEDIRKILFSLGLYPNNVFKRRQNPGFLQLGFHMYGRYNLIKFQENIGFKHKGKSQKLITAIESYKSYGRNETKRRIVELLKENGPLTTKDLCNSVNRNQDIIWKNINRLTKENRVEKILLSKRGSVEQVLWRLKNNLNPNTKFN